MQSPLHSQAQTSQTPQSSMLINSPLSVASATNTNQSSMQQQHFQTTAATPNQQNVSSSPYNQQQQQQQSYNNFNPGSNYDSRNGKKVCFFKYDLNILFFF